MLAKQIYINHMCLRRTTKIANVVWGILFPLLVVSFSTSSAQVDAGQLKQEIRKIMVFDAETDFQQTPGVLMGVLLPDTTYHFSFGVGNPEDSIPLQATDLFELGAFSQVFTALLTIKLVEQGLLSLDQPLARLLSDASFSDAQLAGCTLQDLLRHQTGLERIPMGIGQDLSLEENLYQHFTNEDLLDYLQTASIDQQTYQYSHLSYAVLGLIIEQRVGKSPTDLVDSLVFSPLGLQNTGFQVSGNWAPGFTTGGKKVEPNRHYGSFAPSLGMVSNLEDLSSFASWMLSENNPWRQTLVTETIPTGVRKNTRMGMGWHVIAPKKKVQVLVHTGTGSGHRVYMALVPATQTGVIVLSNSPHGLNGVGWLTLRMINQNWRR
jgi:D-alanyl-D-alanine carboxypeptidase